ncbi:S8 family peptidase [Salipiger sp. P9]|uniref:S8 family peptidase n=1 Tax=Salipiger pentaromativorans TaxID=2943193 RepID=UPI002157FEAB|nr:S8 family peptidase [Salipiger pentaromativorans]MCR8548478.1 S8 family peptidase [Salipiger pentaromativorans]
MADSPRRPLLNPVLRFTQDPKPKRVTGGGKSADSIIGNRLDEQREALAQAFRTMAETVVSQPSFSGQVVVYAGMFEDSLAPSYTPDDLFHPIHGARLIAPHRTGYLIEFQADQLVRLAEQIERTTRIKELVDISRVQSARFFSEENARGGRELSALWDAAPEAEDGRAFITWLMPLRSREAGEHLIQKVAGLRDNAILSPRPLLEDIRGALDSSVPAVMRRSLQAAASEGDRIALAMRDYRQRGHARATVIIPSQAALGQLLASGTVFRIDPVSPITSTAPGDGAEPNRPLPADMSGLPIVGVVDGGLTANSYKSAEAWRAPAFIADVHADTKHGNQVTSLIVQGHDWNNNLALPPLYCQVGTVQAVPKHGSSIFVDPQNLVAYLDGLMGAASNTRVWNFSLNIKEDCPLDGVNSLSHDIAMLARKHEVLPIISIGNKPGGHIQPPADCEAAITVGGRQHDANGNPAGECGVSLSGPGPSCMLKPDLTNFSKVRVIGGTVTEGSSFSTALTSPVAAHTMARLRDASPDLVKALLLHNADRDAFDAKLGFGTPAVDPLPWECRPGFVTLQWTAQLRPGAAFYWELPIPASLRKTGKLKGAGALTAILNPHPMVSEIAGMNYFSARLEAALQFERGVTSNGDAKFHNLLGSLEKERLTEQQARELDHKWSPVRHHKKSFARGVQFDGENLRVYARLFSRDLYLYGMNNADEVPPLDTVFVLSIGTGDENDDVYNELRDELGTFVEAAVIDTEIDVEIGDS